VARCAMSWLRERWSYSLTLLTVCWFGWICIYLTKSVVPPLLPVLSAEWGMSHAQAGMLETAYLLGYIVVKVPAGMLAERMGARRVLAVGILGYAASTALMGLAGGFIAAIMLRFLVGFFQGVHLPVANALLSERFGAKQGRAIGFHESGPNVGNALAYPLAVAIASAFSWQWAFILLSIPAFVLAAATYALVREEPREAINSERGTVGGLRAYIWLLAPLTLAYSAYGLCLQSLFTFTPSFLVEYQGMDLATAGFLATLLPAAGFFAKVSSGFVSERVGRRATICSATLVTGATVGLLTVVHGDALIAALFIVMGLGMYVFSPVIYSTITSSLPSGLKSVALGVVTIFGNLVGAFSTSIVGALIDAGGYRTALLSMSGITLVTTVVVFFALGRRATSS
jgi:sugar phosphate permease